MKKISVLGATGSIGTQALNVIEHSKGEFVCTALCAYGSVDKLSQLANKHRPKLIGIGDESLYGQLKSQLSFNAEIVAGKEAGEICAAYYDCDIVVNGISGMNGFLPLVSAIASNKIIAAANKESIIYGHSILGKFKKSPGDSLVTPFANGARIIPVDSEQSAIFQCLEQSSNIESLILTASGGAFRDLTLEQLEKVTVHDALRHPTWSMGKKITIDSASLFNKGLEIMEAAYLFGFDGEHIEVLIHPQSIVHSAVRFGDGSVKAQLSVPDMRGAIQYAITYPDRQDSPMERLDLTAKPLTFSQVNREKYPAIDLAYAALKKGKVLPIVYNAANEVAVDMFINGQCRFMDIAKIVSYAMNKADTTVKVDNVCDIMSVDNMARQLAANAI